MNKNAAVTNASTEVITGVDTRWSYCHAVEPVPEYNGELKYSTSLLISKQDKKTLADIHAAIEAAYHRNAEKLKGKGVLPALEALKLPLHDGDLERPEDPAYAGCFFLNAKSKKAPKLRDRYGHPIVDPSEIYSGCYGRAAISFYAFNTSGNRGIAVSLDGLQKIRDGEPLGRNFDADKAFTPVEEDENEDFLR